MCYSQKMRAQFKNDARGFTLIELLVVIAIIGILSAVVISSLSTARTKARDAARLSEVHQIQTALQLYYTAQGVYPTTISGPVAIETIAPTLAPYIQLSIDETNTSGTMYYSPASNTNSYLIYVALERQTQASPVSYGCRAGNQPVIDNSGLYTTSPHC